jgi:hypothetical protein
MKIMPALALAITLSFATTTAFAADASVSGYFRAEGKEAKLGFARVAAAKTYGGDPTIAFAFTEKDASDAKEVSSDAIAFSHKYGSAITMTILKNTEGAYEVDESAFHHSESDKAGGNAGGVLFLKDVVVANGVISGDVYTKPDTDMFGAKVEVDLKFKATLPK